MLLFLVFIVFLVLLLGPFRPWAGRHWALLLPAAGGAVAGWFVGARCNASGQFPYLPPLFAVLFAVGFGVSGRRSLLNLTKDGRN